MRDLEREVADLRAHASTNASAPMCETTRSRGFPDDTKLTIDVLLMVSDSDTRPGDAIVIESVRGDRPRFDVNGAYRIMCLLVSAVAACGGRELGADAGSGAAFDASTETANSDGSTVDACVAALPHVDVVDVTTASEVVLGSGGGPTNVTDPSLLPQPTASQNVYMTVSEIAGPGDWRTQSASADGAGLSWSEGGSWYGGWSVPCEAGACSLVAGAASTVVDPNGPGDEAQTFQQYFVYDPTATPPERFARGLIVVAHSYSPIQLSSPTPLMRWNDDDVAKDAPIDLRQFPALGDCDAFGQPGAIVRGTTIDLALTCRSAKGRRIVLLRSADHAASFSFVSTLLDEQDGLALGGTVAEVDAPELFDAGGASYLVVSTRGPVAGSDVPGLDACVTVTLASPDAVERGCDGHPVVTRRIVEAHQTTFGACSYSVQTGYYGAATLTGDPRPARIYRTGITSP